MIEQQQQNGKEAHIYVYTYISDSLVAQRLKHLPAMQETQVQSLGQDDPLEKDRAWQPTPVLLSGEEPGGVHSASKSGTAEAT